MAYIIHRAALLVVRAMAASHSLEVEAQSKHPELLQCLRHFENYFVMHRAAIERVWMADDRCISRNHSRLLWLQNSLQVACLSWYIDMQYLADNTPLLSLILDYMLAAD